jgi:serine protease Do
MKTTISTIVAKTRIRPATALAALLLALAPAGFTGCAAVPGHVQIERAMTSTYPALVRIYVVVQEPSGGRMERMQAAGSGSIISKDGYVVTNHHVAGDASRIVVNLVDGEEIEATRVGTDPMADICVLKLKLDSRKDPNKPLPVAQWGDSDKVRVGDVVLAMGCPGALSQSVTRGIISNTQLIMPRHEAGTFKLDGEDVGAIVRWFAHDAVIYGGNSGGPLVNLDGKIIGINEIGVASLGGAIPGNLARNVAEQIIAHGHVDRSWSGLECQPRLKSDTRDEGVLVSGVVDASPAQKAGLKAGDLVTSWDGQPVNVQIGEHLPLFNQLVCATPIGRAVPITYLRDGNTRTTVLTTVSLERNLGDPKELKDWGIAVRDITHAMALERHRDNTRGVLVDSVRTGGATADSKVPLEGDDVILAVNGKDVDNVAALTKLTADITRGQTHRVPVLVKLDRQTRQVLTVIKIGQDEPAEKPAHAKKPWPSVATQVLTEDLANALNLKGKKGVRVVEVFKGRAADKAGIKVGDIITAIDGTAIEASQPEDREVFRTMVRQYDVGAQAELALLRDGKPLKIAMTLESPPQEDDNAKTLDNQTFEFTAREMTFGDRNSRQMDSDEAGVLIDKAESGGWADLAGLHSGDVLLSIDGQPTSTIAQLKAALERAQHTKPRRLVCFVRRGIHTEYLEIEPDWR